MYKYHNLIVTLEPPARHTPKCGRHCVFWRQLKFHVYNSLKSQQPHHPHHRITFHAVPPASLSSQFLPPPFLHRLCQEH